MHDAIYVEYHHRSTDRKYDGLQFFFLQYILFIVHTQWNIDIFML